MPKEKAATRLTRREGEEGGISLSGEISKLLTEMRCIPGRGRYCPNLF